MFIFPGRVHALNVVDAINVVRKELASRGLEPVGKIRPYACEAQTSNTVTWYEFYVRVCEIGKKAMEART